MATVTITLDGTMVGSVEVSGPDPLEAEADSYVGDTDSSARAAAVAWEAVAKRAVFTVNRGRQFTAEECAEWWA